jgi:hypothetical protein
MKKTKVFACRFLSLLILCGVILPGVIGSPGMTAKAAGKTYTLTDVKMEVPSYAVGGNRGDQSVVIDKPELKYSAEDFFDTGETHSINAVRGFYSFETLYPTRVDQNGEPVNVVAELKGSVKFTEPPNQITVGETVKITFDASASISKYEYHGVPVNEMRMFAGFEEEDVEGDFYTHKGIDKDYTGTGYFMRNDAPDQHILYLNANHVEKKYVDSAKTTHSFKVQLEEKNPPTVIITVSMGSVQDRVTFLYIYTAGGGASTITKPDDKDQCTVKVFSQFHTVSGGGTYKKGEKVTVRASAPGFDWNFLGWYDETTLVSKEQNYSFTVNSDRFLVALYGRKNQLPGHTYATPQKIWGEVLYREAHWDEGHWEFLEMDTVLTCLMKIKTEAGSGCVINLADVTTFELGENSHTIFAMADGEGGSYTEWAQGHTNKSTTQKIANIFSGKTWNHVKKMAFEGNLSVEMNQAVAGEKGTIFTCEETGNESILKVFEGEVEYTHKTTGEVISVKGGEMAAANASGIVKNTFDVKQEALKWGAVVDDNSTIYFNDGTLLFTDGTIIYSNGDMYDPVKNKLIKYDDIKVSEPGSGGLPRLWIFAGAGIVIVAVVIVIIAVSKKKKPVNAMTAAMPPQPQYQQQQVQQPQQYQQTQQPPTQGGKFCPNCGSAVPEGTKFCKSCGARTAG